jgi:hypothetical protein
MVQVMTRQRETVTDRLANIIQVLHLGRKTGLLTVERGDATAFEEGFILFVNGSITAASAGQYNGQEALNRLSAWGTCRFAFVPATASLPALPPGSPGSSGPSTQSMPALKRQETGAAKSVRPARLVKLPAPAARTNTQISQPITPAPVPLIPQRTQPHYEALRLIERAGLSRSHRHLFLLINDRRTTAELAQLTGRTLESLYGLLNDLERAGVIRQ